MKIKQKLNGLLRRLLVRKAPSLASMTEEMLLNYALDLAQEWGDFRMKPIQPRLAKAFPELSEQRLNRLNYVAQETMKFGHDLILSMAQKSGVKNLDYEAWRKAYLKKYNWIDEKNLKRLQSVGTYFAIKQGLI